MMTAKDIAAALGGHRTGAGFRCRCPVPTHGKGRGDRSPSLSISDGADCLLVHCFSGCDPLDVLDVLRRRGLLEDRQPSRNAPPVRHCEPVKQIEPDRRAVDLWRSAEPTRASKMLDYLCARGVTNDPPLSLRFLPTAEYIAGRVYLPAMLAAVQAPDRRVIAVQLTFLDPRGDRKAQVAMPRKTIGALGAGAVRLGPAGECLGLGEGIETGLSAMQLFGLPVWCALGATRMHNVVIPENVRELHIFADADDAGRAAAERTVAAHHHRRVIVHYPTAPAYDFNDVLVALMKKERAA